MKHPFPGQSQVSPSYGTEPNGQRARGRLEASPFQEDWTDCQIAKQQTCQSHRVPAPLRGTRHICLMLLISGQRCPGNGLCSRPMGRWPMSTACCCFKILLFSSTTLAIELELFVNESSSGDRPGTKSDANSTNVNSRKVQRSIKIHLYSSRADVDESNVPGLSPQRTTAGTEREEYTVKTTSNGAQFDRKS